MTDYRLTCRHCGGRFVEMKDLLFHRCPGRADEQNSRRRSDRRPAKARVVTKPQGLFPSGEGADGTATPEDDGPEAA